MALSEGISERQGMHQVAQKLSSTTRPFRSLSLIRLPSSLVNWTSGAEEKFWLALVVLLGVSVLPNCKRDSRFGSHAASRELAKSVTRLLITRTPIRIRITPEATSTLCRCRRNFE